ncbi:hypothetical protein JMJ78_0000994 [Colletotrichum scovillei]|nr:hypothetical protein JMJ78_0000994 [Colletotrichum scovillei]
MLTTIDIRIFTRLDQMIFLRTNYPNRKAPSGTVSSGVLGLLLFYCFSALHCHPSRDKVLVWSQIHPEVALCYTIGPGSTSFGHKHPSSLLEAPRPGRAALTPRTRSCVHDTRGLARLFKERMLANSVGY